MEKFNLYQWQHEYITAMGYPWQVHRANLDWFSYDQLQNSPPDNWNNYVSTEPSLHGVLLDLGIHYEKQVRKVMQSYKCSVDQAKQITKMFVGYGPAYGAYGCIIGPYISEGGGHGSAHIVTEAIDKFGYYTLRKRKATSKEITDSLLNHIEEYRKKFNLDLTMDDFKFVVTQPQVYQDVSAGGRQPNKQIKAVYDNINPSSESFRFYSPEFAGENSWFGLNNNGYNKLLKKLMGPFYDQTILEMAKQQKKDPAQIIKDILASKDTLRIIYKTVYEKYQRAKLMGQDVSPIEPPPFESKSLQNYSGSMIFSKVPSYTRNMAKQMNFRKEILEIINEGLTDSQDIADRMNDNPNRLLENRRRQKANQSPIISKEYVERQLDEINRLRTLEKSGDKKNYSEMLQDTNNWIEEFQNKMGFEDMKTAYESAALYYSHSEVDPSTGAKMEPVILFNPPHDFKNYTSQDLKSLRETNELKVSGEEFAPQKEIENVPEEEVERLFGKDKKDVEVKKEKNNVLPQEELLEEFPIEETPPLPVPKTDVVVPKPEVPSSKDIRITPEDRGFIDIDIGDFPIQEQVVQKTEPAKDSTPSKSKKTKTKTKIKNVSYQNKEMINLMGDTLKNLMKISRELDIEGKNSDSEEIHKVIRKYIGDFYNDL